MGLVDDAMGGSVRALARLASHIENDDDVARRATEQLYPLSGRARTIGVTGPPGVGKSSFVSALVSAIRRSGQTCAVIAVDPTSPLTGGATLGDRIRMLGHHGDSGVFIRSVASRGRSGGLAPATANLIHLFDAIGYDVVIVETVGIGQEEIDIVAYVESVVLLQAPGFGDAVQSLKAGVLEVADVFVVNKVRRARRSGDRQRNPRVVGAGHHSCRLDRPGTIGFLNRQRRVRRSAEGPG